MKTNTHINRALMALAAKSAALVLALASVHNARAQVTNTGTGPSANVVPSNGTDAAKAITVANGNNSAYGYQALLSDTTGIGNTAVGSWALKLNSAGNSNVAAGYAALYANKASFNTALGVQALRFNGNGASNVAVGYQALYKNTSGDFNVAIGDGALLNSTTGDGNIGIGEDGGINLTTGSDNIYIGSPGGAAGESGIIRIGTTKTSPTVGLHTATFLAGVIHGNGAGLTGVPAASVTGTITSAQIGGGAVTNAKIANGAVTTAKLNLLTGNVGIGTNTPSATLDVNGGFKASGDANIGGKILNQKWAVTDGGFGGTGGFPRSQTIVSHGGVMIITVSGSAFSTAGGAGVMGHANVSVDGVYVGQTLLYFNLQDVHQAFPVVTINLGRLSPGNHTVEITSDNSSVVASDKDAWQVFGFELPF